MTDPHWTAVLSALLTPVVAVFGVIVTYRLWRTAQNKLKLDLFDRRLQVYEAARELIASIMTSGKTSPEQEFKYLSGTRGAVWLFDQSIVEYLDEEIWPKVCALWALQLELEGEPVGETRTKNVQTQRTIKKWLSDQQRVMELRFAPFLKLRH
jgi:hypothetical protein